MSQAVIHATELSDGMIKVESFEGFLSMNQIKEAYGHEVYRLYFSSDNYMYWDGVNVWDGITRLPGTIVDKETFDRMVNRFKRCGKNLATAIRDSRKVKSFDVYI